VVKSDLPPRRWLAMLAQSLRGGPARTFPALTRGNLPPMRGRVEICATRTAPRTSTPTTSATAMPPRLVAGGRPILLLDVLRHLGAGRVSALIGDLKAPQGLGLGRSGRSAISTASCVARVRSAEPRRRDPSDARARPPARRLREGVNAALHTRCAAPIRPSTSWSAHRAWQPAERLLTGRACAFVVSAHRLRERARL
jgi:hypothetical protein